VSIFPAAETAIYQIFLHTAWTRQHIHQCSDELATGSVVFSSSDVILTTVLVSLTD